MLLSSSNATGYKGVFTQPSGRFWARRRGVSLGFFDTAVEAAVAYAWAVGEAAAAGEAGPSAAAASEASDSDEGEVTAPAPRAARRTP